MRRAFITKADGGRRPLGILALEDKIVQGAVAEVMQWPDAHPSSMGAGS